MRGYTPEQIEWLKKNVPGNFWAVITERFNKEFPDNPKGLRTLKWYAQETLHLTTGVDTRYRKGHHAWSKGLRGDDYYAHFSEEGLRNASKGRFQKGHASPHAVASGTVGVRKNGIRIVKVDNTEEHSGKKASWQPMSHYMYEQYHNVKLGLYDVVIQLDGDKDNFDMDNLYLTTRTVASGVYNRFTHLSGDPNQMLAAIKCQELITLINESNKLAAL